MVRGWSEGMEVLACSMGYRQEEDIAQELRARRGPRPGEQIPAGPLGVARDGRQASLRIVMRELPAVAVYFGDCRVSPVIQIDCEETSAPPGLDEIRSMKES